VRDSFEPIAVRTRVLASSIFAIVGFIVAIYKDPSAPPMLLAGLPVYAFGAFCVRATRLQAGIFTPINYAQAFFFCQIVAAPLSILLFEVKYGALQHEPSAQSISRAFSVQLLAYLAFLVGATLANKRTSRNVAVPRQAHSYWWAIAFGLFGLAGAFLYYGTVEGYVAYLSSPSERLALSQALDGSVTGAIATIARPFTPAAIVLLVQGYLAKANRPPSLTLLALAALTIFLSALNYNRATTVAPVVAFIAAVILIGTKLRSRHIASMFIVGGAFVLYWGEYRARGAALADVTSGLVSLSSSLDPITTLQVYASSAQFAAFCLEQDTLQPQFRFGSTLVASALSPIPVVGREYRPYSTLTIYNEVIYGQGSYADQIAPFVVELWMNFHFLGPLVGFAALGFVLKQVQTRLHNGNADLFEAFALNYVAFWIAFLVLGNSQILAQTLFFFCWPFAIYLIARRAWSHMLRKALALGAPERAET
jgi:hypothetical protein